MSPAVQAASTAAWKDEGHVVENRRLYREKFAAAFDILRPVLDVQMPDAAFYFWPKTPLPDPEFALRLHREQGVMVLPGSYLAREARGINPGTDRVRIALVASRAETVEAAQRIRALVETL
jgi:N-succinyldiaminopimelate aminotransferase